MKSQIPLKFLIGLILALMIFIPSALWASNLFRISSKALEDFNKLDSIIDDVYDSERGTIEGFPFVMDDDTAILFFSNPLPTTEIVLEILTPGELDMPTGFYEAERPEGCKESKSCVCLARKLESTEVGEREHKKVTFTYTEDPICETKDYYLLGLGTIARGFTDFDGFKNKILYLEKTRDAVIICSTLKDNKCP